MQRQADRGRGYALAFGFATSVLIHALVLLLPVERPSLSREGSEATAVDAPWTVAPIRLVRVDDAVLVDQPGRVTAPTVVAEPDGPVAEVRSPVVESVPPTRRTGPAREEAGGASAPELLAPALADPRLWRARPGRLGELNRWEVEEWLGSVAAQRAEAERRDRPVVVRGMSTWTRSAGAGRWGFSPGRVHAGTLELPMCGGADASECGFGMVPGQKLRYRAWLSQYREIRLQGARMELRERRDERALAIRERRDRARGDSISLPR